MALKTDFADYARHELGRAEGTVKQYLWRLQYLEKLTGKSIETITANDLRAVKRTAPLSSSSIKGLIVAAHAFHSWGVLEGYWKLDGICLVRTPKEINDSSSPLALGEIGRLKATCRAPVEYRLIYLGLFAGMRIGESARFTEEMWRGDWLRFRSLKGGALVETPVHPGLAAVKRKILDSPPVHPATLQKAKERLESRTGIEFVAHQLRKSFASSLYDGDIADEVVGNLLGHTGNVTRIYAAVSRAKRIQAISQLPY